MSTDSQATQDSRTNKVFVIGIDGAVWELLDRWIDDGTLVNLKRVINNGVKGNLESTLPPVTAPAWVSFATGANPGKHGCYDFVLPKGDLDNLRTITSRDIRTDTVYEHLNKLAKKSILVNLPVTFPPKTDDITLGCLITKGDNYIFPEHLKEDLQVLQDYRIVPDMRLLVEGKIDEYIRDISKLERDKFECVKALLERDWELFFVLFSGTDWIQHIMYARLLEPDHNESAALAKEFYRQVDEYIGWFLDNLASDTTLIIMSDHGFKAFNGFFYINEWLKEEGYLSTKEKSKEQPLPHMLVEKMDEALKAQEEQIKVAQETEKKMADEQEKPASDGKVVLLPRWSLTLLSKALRPLAPVHRTLKRYLGIRFDTKPVEPEEQVISEAEPVRAELDADIRSTVAFCPTYQCASVYINLSGKFDHGTVKPEEYEHVRDEIMAKLKSLTHPDSGEPIFKGVLKKEEVYGGLSLNEAPDIVLVRNNYEISADFPGVIFSEKEVNGHAETGIFVAIGEQVLSGHEIMGSHLSITDIAPTVLHLMGAPVPRDMDGRILFEIFREDSDVGLREPDYVSALTHADEVKQRIKKLKSLGKI